MENVTEVQVKFSSEEIEEIERMASMMDMDFDTYVKECALGKLTEQDYERKYLSKVIKSTHLVNRLHDLVYSKDPDLNAIKEIINNTNL